MKFLLLAVAPGLAFAQTAGDGIDVGATLAVYGVAAPFAAICFWQMLRAQAETRELRGQIETMHREALTREQQLVAQVATRFYDSAHLIREGSALAARGAADGATSDERLDRLAGAVEHLVDRMGEAPASDRTRGPRPGTRRSE